MQRDIDWNADEINLKDYDLSQPQLLLLLPDSPICPILVKLFLQVSSLIVIPPAFFEHMPMLQVLDLSNTNILSLPTSIASLSLLQEFFLRDCSALIELPTQVGMLSKLKLFDIKGTELMFIPKEMQKFVDLEVLRVSLSQYAKEYVETKSDIEKVIPKNMISELKKLKELCISVPPEAEWWEEEVKDIQNELCELENLETLRWYLPTNEVLQQFLLLEGNKGLIYENLSNLMLTIGHHAQLTSCLPSGLEKKFVEFRNCLKWKNGEGNMNDVSKIMESAEALFLSRHWTIKKFSTLDVTNLKYCLLAECNEMESLVEVDGSPEDLEARIKNGEKVGLELLQYFSIHHMEKLQCIWKGPIGKDSLSKLTILALHSCPQLTSIFTLDIAQNLSCLMELTVEDCPKIRSLITTESQNIKHSSIFPSLVRLFLLDLPELVNMFNGLVKLEKLSTLLIYNCLKLQHLSIMELPHIKKIEAEVEWWKDLDCDKFTWENIFVPLKRKKDLVEQLFEARNSLQHFHDTLSHGMANSRGPSTARNMTYNARNSLLPPKCPFPTIAPSYADYIPTSAIGQQRTPKYRDVNHSQHHRASSESLVIEEQPSWLDELLNEPETPVQRGHRRASSDSFTYLEAANAANTEYAVKNVHQMRNLNSNPSWVSQDFLYKDARNTSFFADPNVVMKNRTRGWDSPKDDNLGLRRSVSLGTTQKLNGIDSTAGEKQDADESSPQDSGEACIQDANLSTERKDFANNKTSASETDTKRAKQQFAQRSRVRKLQYIAELERNVQALQAEGYEVSAQLEFLNQQSLILGMENKALKQRLENLAQEQLIKHLEHEVLEREIGRLRALYQQQQQPQPPPLQSHHRIARKSPFVLTRNSPEVDGCIKACSTGWVTARSLASTQTTDRPLDHPDRS